MCEYCITIRKINAVFYKDSVFYCEIISSIFDSGEKQQEGQLGGSKLVENWPIIIENISPDKITVKSIPNFLFTPTQQDKTVTTIKVPAKDWFPNMKNI